MTQLGTIQVSPVYGQVVIECEDASDLPVPETGAERVVATTQSLLIATRSDHDGDVLIEVRTQEADPPAGQIVFDGELNCPSQRIIFGSSLGNQLASAPLDEAGWIPVQVYVDPPDSPARVTVIVGAR